ncbi:MAG TPA: class I SAM-dependent methyltransferase [Candidatus Nitrosocosmicus sp.]|nr:class I SAM-dependent methyltransferase [Candidatus Nitrosocosmicus sp.]
MNWLGELVQEYITPIDTVLDLGCGIMNAIKDINCKSILGVDIWDKYLDEIKHLHPTIKLSMEETDRFMDKSFDVVICLDVIEHLDKQLALKIIKECKRICRKTAMIYTPHEFKDNIESIDDSWGLGENPHQKHLCLINESDLTEENYDIDNPIGEGFLGVYRNV